MVALLGVPNVAAQNTSIAPWVLVVPAANQTGNSALDPVGGTVADTIELTLRLLGDFEVRELPPERIPDGVIRGDPAALEAFSERETMDYIVFGALDQIGEAEDASFVITASVWERASQSITVSERETAASIFGTFDASDTLATSFVTAFSGQRIAFGSLRLQNTGWDEGSYRVLIDGSQVAVDQPRIDSVLIGEREITVVANNGADPGAVVLEERVQIAQGALAEVSFEILPPPSVTEAAPDPEPEEEPTEEPIEEPEAVAATEPEEPAVAEAPEPEAEPEPQIEVSPRPWSRNTRTAEGRRPIVSYGGAVNRLQMLTNGRTFSGSQQGVGFDFNGGWYHGISFGLTGYEGVDNDQSDTIEQVRDDIANGAEIELRIEGGEDFRWSIGYRLGEWQWGPARADLIPVGRVGISNRRSFFYRGDQWVSTLQPADGSRSDSTLYGVLGIGVISRVHFWRFSLVAQLYADYNLNPRPDEVQEGDELYPEDDLSTPITTVAGIDPGLSPGFSLGGSLGLALSIGGRAPDRSDDRSTRER